jgi:hypothetical protein
MRSFAALAVVFLFVLQACEKDPYIPVSTSFHHSYAGSGNLTGREILKRGNGFMVCGYGNGPANDEDFVLLETDSMGGETARHFVGTGGNDQCWSFTQSPDGGYVIAGWTDVNAAGVSNDVLIVKTDANGQQQWSRIYGGAYNDLGTDIIRVAGGYVVAAIKGSNADENIWLLRLDENGDTLWTLNYGGNSPDGAMAVCDNGDGTYGITGYTNSGGNGSTDGYTMIVNDAGQLLHYWPFGTPRYEEPHCISHTGDGWIVSGHAGTTDIHTHNVFMQFIGNNGETGKFLTYGDHEHEGAEAMVIHRNEIYIAGRSSSRDPLQDGFFVHTDISGNEIERAWIGTPDEDPAFGLYVDDFQVLFTGYMLNPATGRRSLVLQRK